jgi:hypothetical protein
MAIFHPDIETIKKLRQKPTDGELYLLQMLDKFLSNEYEVFFQPFVNGDIPDVVVMRRGGGVLIFEVKDWELSHYSINEKRNWFVTTSRGERQPIKSPLKQVLTYKENLFNLHIEGLLEKRIENFKMLSIVSCAIYFHKESTLALNHFVKTKFAKDERDPSSWNNYLGFLSHFDLLGNDGLTEESIKAILDKRWISRKSFLFDQQLYESFKRCFSPSKHIIEQGKNIIYSKEQEKVISSSGGLWQKVKGVAGSGKTLCLAKRAVNSHLRHGGNVLILSFNITLRNYIRDRISEVREGFSWDSFHVIHFHQFFSNMANNFNLHIEGWESWNSPSFFESVKSSIKVYDTILIDEIQDFDRPWVDLIIKYFLNPNGGEYVAYGDEKQNIYNREYELKEKKPYTKIGGQWNLLKRSFRVSNKIGRLAEFFQREFFADKYEFDEILTQGNLFDKSEIGYHMGDKFDPELVYRIYRKIADKYRVHDNDICIQAGSISPLRILGQYIETKTSQKTNTMFESQAIYLKILKDNNLTDEQYTVDQKRLLHRRKRGESLLDEETRMLNLCTRAREELKKLRRNKKFNYWDNRGLLKLSTIHSFKGWEIDTLILLITNDDEAFESGDDTEVDVFPHENFTSEELIYTAITRCRTNLFVVNFGNEQYDSFFKKWISAL